MTVPSASRPSKLQQPDVLGAPAANVNDRSACGRRQRGTDVTPVNKSRRFVSAASAVMCGARLVETNL